MEDKIGRYRIVSELGRGGMGVVYRAHEESLNRYVAIKVLGEHLSEDTTYVQRFVREAQSAAKLNHPNIVQIYSIDEDAGRHYFVMEYVTGTSVYRRLKSEGKMQAVEAARLILQAAAGLSAAYDAGIVHRDIKPANLMIDERGLLKIADFGLAMLAAGATKLTATGMFLGTPGYLSPEQCLDKDVDHRTDIYSLGVTFFEMLTGVIPFRADSPLALIKQIIDVQPPDVRELNPEVDDTARAILQRMMAKDRDQRYQSCHELIADLQEYLSQSGATSLPVVGMIAGAAAAKAAGQDGATKLITQPTSPAPPSGVAPAVAATAATPPVPAATPPPVSTQEPFSAGPPPVSTEEPFTAGPPPSPVAAESIDPFAPPIAAERTTASSQSRGALVAILVLVGIGLALLAGGTTVAWKAGWLDKVMAMARAEKPATGDGQEVVPGGTQQGDAGQEVADPGATGVDGGSVTGGDVGGSAVGATGGDQVAAASGGQPPDQGVAPTTGLPVTSSSGNGAGATPSSADSDGSGGQQIASGYGSPSSSSQSSQASGWQQGGTQHSGGQQYSGGHAATSQQSGTSSSVAPPTRSQGSAAQTGDDSVSAVPEREPLGTAVVAVGETLLASEAEAFIEKALNTRTRTLLIDEKGFPEVYQLVISGEPDLPTLIEAMRPHARFMLLVRAEYLGDRRLTYMGRVDTVHQSRLTIVPYHLRTGVSLSPGFNEKVEYNQLSVERKVEQLLRPTMRQIIGWLRNR